MFIREPFAEKIVTNEKISRISFMSDVGGLLGLFMGFSFVSAVEIIYHAFKVSMLGPLRPPTHFLAIVLHPPHTHLGFRIRTLRAFKTYNQTFWGLKIDKIRAGTYITVFSLLKPFLK